MADRYKILHTVSSIIPYTIEESIAGLVDNLTSDETTFNFAIFQVPRGIDMVQWPDRNNRIGPLFGYNRNHHLPFFSDPTGEIKGGFALLGHTMIYLPNALPLEAERDAYVWSYAINEYFTDRTLADILPEFIAEGYELSMIEQPDHLMLTAVYSPAGKESLDTAELKPISLEEITRK